MKVLHFLLIPVLLITGCFRRNEIPVKIERIEQQLFTAPVDSIEKRIEWLRRHHGQLLKLYSEGVLNIVSPDDPAYLEQIKAFVTDEYMKMAAERVVTVYPDLTQLEKKLGHTFYRFQKEFPDHAIPKLYSLTSGFNQSMITADSILAIALDKYLGSEEEMYHQLEVPAYLRHTMNDQHLAADCIRAWLYTEFPYINSTGTVLENIMYEGKILYVLRELMPDIPDSVLLGCTSMQMNWCSENIRQIWTYVVEKRMLFQTDYFTVRKLIDPAPFCSFFGQLSPGRSGSWLGYLIIDSYMQHSRTAPAALIADNNYQQMLANSRFSP
jgi:hypothetical protein